MNSDWLRKLCAVGGVSGQEDAVRDILLSLLPPEAETQTDGLGNLIVRKKGAARPKNTVMLCAHMDEVGMLVTYISSDGMLKFSAIGMDRKAYLGKRVAVGCQALPGVVGVTPVHLLSDDKQKTIPAAHTLYIDIGAADREAAEALVQPGDAVQLTGDLASFGDGCWKGKALDDRMGCLLLLELLQEDLPYDICVVFTVQEEVGLRGAKAAAFSVDPAYAVVVETTTAADLPDISGAERVCRLGGGAVVSFMDKGTIYPFALYRSAMALAAQHGIPVQTKSLVAGGNDAGAIHQSRGGVPTLAISVPCRYLHSPACVAKEADWAAVAALTRLVWEDFCQQ
ncbi:MAG: M20/M25/M40 family metallo-hydrolase [Oscillospiraceae bacterium]|jgi:endoglucanase|nr:M20/M25/M40 family metallo-hydrolase [Oscillospiraceae bacterium]